MRIRTFDLGMRALADTRHTLSPAEECAPTRYGMVTPFSTTGPSV